jgi:prefoldin subunit 5
MEEFTTVMTQYEEKINELTGDIANLDAEIAALNKRITLC